jgi:hypothetical protein
MTEPDDAEMARMVAEYVATVRPRLRPTDRVVNVSGTSVEAVRQAAMEYGINVGPGDIVDLRHAHYAGERAERITCAEAHCGTHPS